MIYPGEYVEGLLRTTNVMAPVVGGYVTSRLRVQGEPTVSTSGWVDATTAVVIQNTGIQSVTVRLQGCADYLSGPREWVGASQTVVPSGRTTYSVTPRHTYLEVKCLSGTSAIKMQLSSRLKWEQLGFDKSDPYYPPFLFNARNPLTAAV